MLIGRQTKTHCHFRRLSPSHESLLNVEQSEGARSPSLPMHGQEAVQRWLCVVLELLWKGRATSLADRKRTVVKSVDCDHGYHSDEHNQHKGSKLRLWCAAAAAEDSARKKSSYSRPDEAATKGSLPS